jgi:hypothetical protein
LVECLAIEHEIAAQGLSEAALAVSGGQARPDLVVPWVTTASAFGGIGDPRLDGGVISPTPVSPEVEIRAE